MKRTIQFVMSLAIAFAMVAGVNADLVINEVRIDQPGTDVDEYFELYADGMSFGDLGNYWYVVIGDTSAGGGDQFGIVENATQLTGQSLNDGDFLLVGEVTIGTADLDTNLNFENSDNVTHLLVTDFIGVVGDDLDTDNDGTLDFTPWDTVVDGFGLIETVGSGDGLYHDDLGLAGIGPDGSFVPAHSFRDVDGTAGAWQVGSFGDLSQDTAGFSNVSVPEPTTLSFLGLFGLAAFTRRRK